MVIKKDIVYPNILKCCDCTNDNFWKCVFEDLAYGKTVYGTYILKDFICCGYKGKEFSYKIDHEKAPDILYKEVYNLLNKKLGLCSQTDKNKRKETFDSLESHLKTIQNSNWSSIKKKGIKELLIENFVIDMKNKYDLTITQTKKLLLFISTCILFKVIVSSDINYECGKIQSIDGITFKPKKIILEKSLNDCVSDDIQEVIFEKNTMSDLWAKYLSNLMKQL